MSRGRLSGGLVSFWFTDVVILGAVDLLSRLLADLNVRSPFGVTWSASGPEVPLSVAVVPADYPGGSFTVTGNSAEQAVAGFALEVQQWLAAVCGFAVPRCPSHEQVLHASVVDTDLWWRCPAGDFECVLGEYLLALWPPTAGDMQASPALAARLSRRGLRWAEASVTFDQTSAGEASITLFEGEDETTTRAAAAPLRAKIEWASQDRTERYTDTTSSGLVRGLRLVGGRARHMASLRGSLARIADLDGVGDVLVGGTPVRIGPEHRLGGPSESLLLDADGDAFADVGDMVSCAGGYPPSTNVHGETNAFYAWQITVPEA
jgi:hypothetical protein